MHDGNLVVCYTPARAGVARRRAALILADTRGTRRSPLSAPRATRMALGTVTCPLEVPALQGVGAGARGHANGDTGPRGEGVPLGIYHGIYLELR